MKTVKVKTVRSEVVRNNWRSMLDTVFTNEATVVIKRHGHPAGVLINYKEWQEKFADAEDVTIENIDSGFD